MNPGQKESQPSCSVVICTRNRPDELNRCLEAVSRLDYPRFNTLVVDNAPSSDLARQVAARWGAAYLLEPKAGLSRARNAGARSCATEIVAYLDDDCVAEREWLARLAVEFRDPTVMAVTGPVMPLEKGRPGEDRAILACHAPSRQWERLDRQNPYWFEIASFGGMGLGGNMALRRRAFEFWAGFDERLGRGAVISGCEEHFAFAQLVENGYAIIFTPGAVVRHPRPATAEDLKIVQRRDYPSGAAYAVLLLVESRHRWKILKYLLLGQLGIHRGWQGPSKPLAPRWRIVLACLPAPFLYLRSCLGHTVSYSGNNRLSIVSHGDKRPTRSE